MKQTAVEWLVSELPTIDWTDPYWQAKLKEAKEMEKNQACGFARDFIDDRCYAAFDGSVKYDGAPENYYDETLNTNEK